MDASTSAAFLSLVPSQAVRSTPQQQASVASEPAAAAANENISSNENSNDNSAGSGSTKKKNGYWANRKQQLKEKKSNAKQQNEGSSGMGNTSAETPAAAAAADSTAKQGQRESISDACYAAGADSGLGSEMKEQPPEQQQQKKKKRSKNKNKKSPNATTDEEKEITASCSGNDDNEAVATAPLSADETVQATESERNREKQQQQQHASKKKKNNNKQQQQQQQQQLNINNKKKQQQQQPRGRSRPWLKHIPKGSVDPITLDSLFSLPYPPFAVVASEPYEPVPVWPPPSPEQQQEDDDNGLLLSKKNRKTNESQEEYERRILQEQWGSKAVPLKYGKNDDTNNTNNNNKKGQQSAQVLASTTTTKNDDNERKVAAFEPAASSVQRRHYNLFDGRALAYYMASQLQFIDPLNRRDLTRDELVNLDRYLRRHGFLDLNVTEAYDVKGVTLSSAGAAAHTATGRATILQEEARNLLNALFGGGGVVGGSATRSGTTNSSSTRTTNNYNNSNNLQSLYQATEQAELSYPSHRNNNMANQYVPGQVLGVYGEEGMLIIDDDENPGLRGSAPAFTPHAEWPGRPVTNALRRPREQEFPSLRDTVVRAPTQQQQQQQYTAAAAFASTSEQQHQQGQDPQQQPKPKKPLPPSKTLAKISGAIKKTDPEELHRQWEAREEARRKAMLCNMTFGSNPSAWDSIGQGPMMSPPSAGPPMTITTTTFSAPSDAQIERNRALADALGVTPATARLNAGWARPVEQESGADGFGRELNITIYSEELIMKAKGRLGQLVKLEKKWIKFLADDTAASLPLTPMDRPMRAFVHEYSDFWKLHTESFDNEPKRYIHCVKLKDTRAPYPLLSDAARNARPQPSLMIACDHSLQQTAGQSTRGRREIPTAPQRAPLPLKPRSSGIPGGSAAAASGATIGGAPTRTMTESSPGNSRFDGLVSDKDRPKLLLQKRTLPLDLPPPPGFDIADEFHRRREEKVEEKSSQEQEQLLMKQKIMALAFASDEDDSGASGSYDDEEEEDYSYNNGNDEDPGSTGAQEPESAFCGDDGE